MVLVAQATITIQDPVQEGGQDCSATFWPAEAAQPRSDHRGSADYKRHVVATFVRRGLARDLEAAA